MTHPLLIFSQSDYLIQIVDIKFTFLKANSADPDQKPADLDLHCLQRQEISGFSRTRVKRITCDSNDHAHNWKNLSDKFSGSDLLGSANKAQSVSLILNLNGFRIGSMITKGPGNIISTIVKYG